MHSTADHAEVLRKMRREWIGETIESPTATEGRLALDAAIAALEAGRSGEAEPVVWQLRFMFHDSHGWSGWMQLLDAGNLEILAERYRRTGHQVETRALYAAAPQQPPPVGVTDAVRALPAKWRARAEAIATKHYLGIGDISDRDMLRIHADDLDAALSQQEAAPSVSEEHQAASDAMNYGAGFLVDGKRVAPYRVRAVKCPPKDAVSEPAASGDNEMECTCIVSDHCEIHFPNRTKVTLEGLDAASGEGLSLADRIGFMVADGRHMGINERTIDLDVLEEAARRLTTTGQGDVERLTEIKQIIENVDNRAMAVDGPVPSTMQVMTQQEMSRIYMLAGGKPNAT